MPVAFLVLLGCQFVGELLRAVLHLPVPGPVIGMFLLAGALALRDRNQAPADTGAPAADIMPGALDRVAGQLLTHMGLLFVPAGVGIIAEAGLLRQEWKPIAVALVGSTVLSLAVTGFVMHRLGRGVQVLGAPETRLESRAGGAS